MQSSASRRPDEEWQPGDDRLCHAHLVTLEDTMALATKHLNDHFTALVGSGQLIDSMAVEDIARDLRSGFEQLQRRLGVLCPALTELVDLAAGLTPPQGCTVKVSPMPDIYVERADGHWFGFRTALGLGADGQGRPVWVAWRCSISTPHPPRFGTLQEVVDHYGGLEL